MKQNQNVMNEYNDSLTGLETLCSPLNLIPFYFLSITENQNNQLIHLRWLFQFPWKDPLLINCFLSYNKENKSVPFKCKQWIFKTVLESIIRDINFHARWKWPLWIWGHQTQEKNIKVVPIKKEKFECNRNWVTEK